MQLAGQVRHDHDGAAQDADDQQFFARVVAVDLLSHFGEPTVHILGGDQDFFQVVTHIGGVHRVLFSYRCYASDSTISVPHKRSPVPGRTRFSLSAQHPVIAQAVPGRSGGAIAACFRRLVGVWGRRVAHLARDESDARVRAASNT